MELSFFSFFMAVLWSSLFFCILAFLQKDIRFIRHFGVTTIFLIYLGCIIRFLFPVKFSFTKVIPDGVVYAAFYRFFCLNKLDLGFFQISLLEILTFISISITIVLTIRFFQRYLAFQHLVSTPETMNSAQKSQLIRVLNRLHPYRQCRQRIPVSYSSQVSVPAGIGLWRKHILLPHVEYTDQELYYILLHEFTHFGNRDLFVKMGVALLCNFFWWNPFVYLLRRNLDEVLEIKCDLCVVAHMDNQEKADYLTVIITSLERALDIVSPVNRLPNACLIGIHKEELLKKRFALTAFAGNAMYHGTVCTLYLLLAVLTFIGSYSFTIQPRYNAPVEQIVTNDSAYEMTPDNAWLSINDTGQYFLTCRIGQDTDTVQIPDAYAEMLINDGFELIGREKK